MPMMQPYQQSIQESSEDIHCSNPQILHHVLKNLLRLFVEERVSFSEWMKHNNYINIHELCEALPCRLKDLHKYSDYIVDEQHFVLKCITMHKIKLFISWMSTRKRETRFQLSSQYLLSLTYQDFQKFRLKERIREDKEQAPPTAPTPSTTKPLLSHISGSEPYSLPHYCDLFDESACEAAEENLLQPQIFIPYDLWEEFPEAARQIVIEYNKKVKVVKPKQSFVLDTPHPQSQPVHSPDICFSPETSPQDVNESHLSDSTSTTTNLNETFSLDTSQCDHLLHLGSPSLSSELQDTSIVESTETESIPDFEDLLQLDPTSVSSQDTSSIEIEFVSEFEGKLDNTNLSPTDVLSMQHDYDLSQLNQEIDTPSDNLHHQDTHVCEKKDQDDFLIHAIN